MEDKYLDATPAGGRFVFVEAEVVSVLLVGVGVRPPRPPAAADAHADRRLGRGPLQIH